MAKELNDTELMLLTCRIRDAALVIARNDPDHAEQVADELDAAAEIHLDLQRARDVVLYLQLSHPGELEAWLTTGEKLCDEFQRQSIERQAEAQAQ